MPVILSGCAISGSGNPRSTHHVGINEDTTYIHDEQNVIVQRPERRTVQQIQRIKRSKVKGCSVKGL